MAVQSDAVTESVRRAVAEFNQGEERPLSDTPATVLLGPEGAVDSLGLVRLVMTVERQVEDDFGVAGVAHRREGDVAAQQSVSQHRIAHRIRRHCLNAPL